MAASLTLACFSFPAYTTNTMYRSLFMVIGHAREANWKPGESRVI